MRRPGKGRPPLPGIRGKLAKSRNAKGEFLAGSSKCNVPAFRRVRFVPGETNLSRVGRRCTKRSQHVNCQSSRLVHTGRSLQRNALTRSYGISIDQTTLHASREPRVVFSPRGRMFFFQNDAHSREVELNAIAKGAYQESLSWRRRYPGVNDGWTSNWVAEGEPRRSFHRKQTYSLSGQGELIP